MLSTWLKLGNNSVNGEKKEKLTFVRKYEANLVMESDVLLSHPSTPTFSLCGLCCSIITSHNYFLCSPSWQIRAILSMVTGAWSLDHKQMIFFFFWDDCLIYFRFTKVLLISCFTGYKSTKITIHVAQNCMLYRSVTPDTNYNQSCIVQYSSTELFNHTTPMMIMLLCTCNYLVACHLLRC